jgi:hypothetical protein
VRNAGDFGRGRACGCVRIALQLFVRCVYALERKVKVLKARIRKRKVGRLKARRWKHESKMAKVRRKSSARDALEAWVRGASDFGRGRADGCVRIALQLFVRCVYALVPPPPHWVCLRRLRT